MTLRIGVNVDALPDLPEPSEIPAQVARFQAIDGPPFYYTGVYASMLKEAGKEGLARSQWHREAGWGAEEWGDARWVRAWAENIDTELVEYGNEPHPEYWNTYRHHLTVASPILRASGRKVTLAAARTNRTTDWLSTTPDSVFEACDGVAVHPYSQTPGGVLECVQEARTYVPAHLPLYASEFGWSIDDPKKWPNNPVVPTPHLQRMKINGTLKLLAEQADDLNLKLASVFMHKDFGPECDRWWRHAGITREDGSHRPAFDVVAKASK